MSAVYGFSPERQQAEIFARLGVLYHGDPQLMQRELPTAYEAFHDLFGTTLLSPESRVLRDIRSAGSSRSGPSSSQNRQGTGFDGGTGQRNQVQRSDSGLESLRDRTARIFVADRSGALIRKKSVTTAKSTRCRRSNLCRYEKSPETGYDRWASIALVVQPNNRALRNFKTILIWGNTAHRVVCCGSNCRFSQVFLPRAGQGIDRCNRRF